MFTRLTAVISCPKQIYHGTDNENKLLTNDRRNSKPGAAWGQMNYFVIFLCFFVLLNKVLALKSIYCNIESYKKETQT